MAEAIQYDLFEDPVDVLRLEQQKQEMQLHKLRRSLFARINALENLVNELNENVASKDEKEKLQTLISA